MSIKLGVLISGSGTNLQAIIDRIADGTLDASIELVVSSRADAYGLLRAQAAGIQTLTMDKSFYDEDNTADRIIASEMHYRNVDYILMAGYMRMVHEPLLAAFENRIVNIHPALLPSFKGAHGIQDAYDYGVKVTGVTVHFADNRYAFRRQPLRLRAHHRAARARGAGGLDRRRARGRDSQGRACAVSRGRGAARRRPRARTRERHGGDPTRIGEGRPQRSGWKPPIKQYIAFIWSIRSPEGCVSVRSGAGNSRLDGALYD